MQRRLVALEQRQRHAADAAIRGHLVAIRGGDGDALALSHDTDITGVSVRMSSSSARRSTIAP